MLQSDVFLPGGVSLWLVLVTRWHVVRKKVYFVADEQYRETEGYLLVEVDAEVFDPRLAIPEGFWVSDIVYEDDGVRLFVVAPSQGVRSI